MSLTPEQLAKIQQKESTLPDALRRDALTNYREGYFFVTINTRGYAPILSYISGRADANDGAEDEPRCVYTELGKRVMECWRNIPNFYPYAEAIDCEAMPDHFHGLIHIRPGGKPHLGQIIRGFMIGGTHAYWDTLGIDWRPQPGVITRDYRDRDHTRSFRGPALFVRGYNDVEAITIEQVETKRRYIREQARRALIKGSMPDCFRIHRNCNSHGWTMDALRRAFLADRYLALDSRRIESTLLALLPRIQMLPGSTNLAQSPNQSNSAPNIKPVLSFIGMRTILAAQCKLPLICHRSDAMLFEVQRDIVLQAARKGAVIVSAFISPKEREIKKQLLIEQLPVIEVMDNGFADRYKPTGKSFYACAENRLVQISPWTYAYSRDIKVTREMCLVMNQLVRIITNKDDHWWKKYQ